MESNIPKFEIIWNMISKKFIWNTGRMGIHKGGSINRGTPNSWMVYNGKYNLDMDDLGVPVFQETSIWNIPIFPYLNNMEYYFSEEIHILE